MPTYVYECKKCEKTFEVEQRITADPLSDCDCGSRGSLRRLIQPTAVMFKGGGFHINDYAAPAPAETKAEPKGECTGEPAACPACAPPAAE
jgi:putative FmdB family regulatory protein